MDEQIWVSPSVSLWFHVRPERTLVTAAVMRRLGGPHSVLWRSGWSLGLSGRDLTGLAPEALPSALMSAFLADTEPRLIGPAARAAWIKTWKPDLS